MGVIARARDLLQRRSTPRSGVIARVIPRWKENRPLPQAHDTRKLLDEGYRKHSIIHVCIREIAQTAADPIPRVVRDGVLLEQHPALALLKNPNPLQTWYEFIELLLTYLQSVGNAYIHKVRSARGRVVELWLLRPDRTRIVPGSDGMILRYEFTVDGETTGVHIPPGDVVHVRLPDPLDDYYGLPPVAVAARIADLDTNSIDYLRAFFLNSGTPAGLLKFKIRVDKPERERVKEQWVESHTGLAGWHSISVLDADADYQPIGANVKDADPQHVFDITESRIPAVWGVPPIIVGMRLGLDKATYSNYASARSSFWQETVRPMYRRIQAKLTAGIVREFDESAELVLDLSEVDALQESIDSRRKFAVEGWREALLTKKQALELVGIEAEPGDEDLLIVDIEASRLELPEPIPVTPVAAVAEDEEERARLLIERHALPAPTERHDSDEDLWKTLHRIADKGAIALRRAFLRAVAVATDATVLAKVEAALKAKDYAAAEAAIPWDSHAVRVLESEMPEELRKIVVEAGVASADFQPRPMSWSMNEANPLAVEWAQAHSAHLVREVTEQTRQAIRDAVARAIDEGRGSRVAAREIRDVIGLTRRQEQSIENLRARLKAEGLSAEKVQERLSRERQKLARRRALVIARTESMTAANTGQQLLWKDAERRGLVDAQMYREWVVTPDDRTCAFCAPMHGTRVLLDGEFEAGAVTRKNGTSVQLPSVMTPPLHPSCRCVMRLIVD